MESSFIAPSSSEDTKTTVSTEVPFVGTEETNTSGATNASVENSGEVAPESTAGGDATNSAPPASTEVAEDHGEKTDKDEEDDGNSTANESVVNGKKWHPLIPLSFELPDSFVPAPPSRGGPGGEGPHLDSPVHISPMKLSRAFYDVTGQVYYEIYPNVYQLFKTRSNKARNVMMKNIITSLSSPDCIVLPVPYTAQTGRKPHPCVLVTAEGLRKLVDILKDVSADVREAVDKLVEVSSKVSIDSELHRAESMERHLVSMGPTWRKAFEHGEPEPQNNEQILRPRKSTSDPSSGPSSAGAPSSAMKRDSIASRRSRRHRTSWRKRMDDSYDSEDGMEAEKHGHDDDDEENENATDGVSASEDEMETPRPKRVRTSFGEMDATQYRVGIVRMIEINEEMAGLRARIANLRGSVEALKQSYPGFSDMIAAEKKRLDAERKKKQIEQWMFLGQDEIEENANPEEENSGDEDYRPGMSDDDDTVRAHPRNSTHAHHVQHHQHAQHQLYPGSNTAIPDVSSTSAPIDPVNGINPNVPTSSSASSTLPYSQQQQQQQQQAQQQQQYLSALVQQQQQQFSVPTVSDPTLMNVKVAAMQYQLPPAMPPSSTFIPEQTAGATATSTSASSSSPVNASISIQAIPGVVLSQQQQQQQQQLTTAFTSLSDVAAEAMAEDAEPNPMLSQHI